jgi:hypothetical protein
MGKLTRIAALSLGLVASAETARAGGNLPGYGSFPLQWLEGVTDVYPVTAAPKEIQWQTWLAVRALSSAPKATKLRIETHDPGSAREAAKLRDYLVGHHRFPASRFVLAVSERPGWGGWIVVRPEGAKVALDPPDAPAPGDVPVLALSEVDTLGAGSQGAPLPTGAVRTMNYASAVQRGWLGSSGWQFRPAFGIQWFNVEGAKGFARRARASWMGAWLQQDLALLRWPVGEMGVDVHFFRSFTAVSDDAKGGSVSEGGVKAHVLLKANSTLMGMPMIRLSGGYFRNVRSTPRNAELGILPGMSGAQVSAELSTFVDGMFTLGLAGAYVFTADGVISAGGSLSHRLFEAVGSTWDARIGLTASVARQRTGAVLLEESWSAFQFGVAAAF